MTNAVEILVAIVITVLLGETVGLLMEYAVPKRERPNFIEESVWIAMTKNAGPGKWIGRYERLIALMSFWIPAYEIIGGWLAFKVAAKWEVWANVVQMPSHLEGVSELEWYQERVHYGSWLLSRFLIGTLINVLIAALAAFSGKHFWEFVGLVCTK